jgi:hypothetical protein
MERDLQTRAISPHVITLDSVERYTDDWEGFEPWFLDSRRPWVKQLSFGSENRSPNAEVLEMVWTGLQSTFSGVNDEEVFEDIDEASLEFPVDRRKQTVREAWTEYASSDPAGRAARTAHLERRVLKCFQFERRDEYKKAQAWRKKLKKYKLDVPGYPDDPADLTIRNEEDRRFASHQHTEELNALRDLITVLETIKPFRPATFTAMSASVHGSGDDASKTIAETRNSLVVLLPALNHWLADNTQMNLALPAFRLIRGIQAESRDPLKRLTLDEAQPFMALFSSGASMVELFVERLATRGGQNLSDRQVIVRGLGKGLTEASIRSVLEPDDNPDWWRGKQRTLRNEFLAWARSRKDSK